MATSCHGLHVYDPAGLAQIPNRARSGKVLAVKGVLAEKGADRCVCVCVCVCVCAPFLHFPNPNALAQHLPVLLPLSSSTPAATPFFTSTPARSFLNVVRLDYVQGRQDRKSVLQSLSSMTCKQAEVSPNRSAQVCVWCLVRIAVRVDSVMHRSLRV